MQSLQVGKNEAGQRLDKLLAKYLNTAPKSFLYKMLRKKNIKLNGRKAEGNEKLAEGDVVELYLSDETIRGFQKAAAPIRCRTDLPIIYEDQDLLLINKPAGLLSQKAKPTDVSLVEQVTAYLLESGQLTEEDLKVFHPGVCNRLDRNTSGLIAAGKTLAGLQTFHRCFQDRSLHKFYRTIVLGKLEKPCQISGWLLKDEKTNQVRILKEEKKDALPIETAYTPLSFVAIQGRPCTYLEVQLLTGRAHQIRAHLASIGHPIIGDEKYGSHSFNVRLQRSCGLSFQLLHSCRMDFPVMEEPFAHLSGRVFEAPLPKIFDRLLKQSGKE